MSMQTKAAIDHATQTTLMLGLWESCARAREDLDCGVSTSEQRIRIIGTIHFALKCMEKK